MERLAYYEKEYGVRWVPYTSDTIDSPEQEQLHRSRCDSPSGTTDCCCSGSRPALSPATAPGPVFATISQAGFIVFQQPNPSATPLCPAPNVRKMFGMGEDDFSYRDALPSGPAHRRGAGINPGNRFETVRLHVLGEELDRQWVERESEDGNSVNRVERQVFLIAPRRSSTTSPRLRTCRSTGRSIRTAAASTGASIASPGRTTNTSASVAGWISRPS